MKKLYIGVDIGGTKILAALVTENGQIMERLKQSTPKAASSRRIAALISRMIKDLCFITGTNHKTLAGVGIGFPGIIEPRENRILCAPNVSFLGTALAINIRKKLGVKVIIGNDVNCGILGEKWLGAARNFEHAVGIFLGTGIGGGVISDGRLLQGHRGGAGELGHMTIEIDGPKCTCGNRGCFEAFAGRWAIERDLKAALEKGEKSILTKWLDDKSSSIKSKLLKKALKKEDPLTTKVMEKVARTVGSACISIRHLYGPQVIILGGGLIEACGDFLMPGIEAAFKEDVFFKKLGKCKLVRSKLGDDAVILGAVRMLASAK
jgi:glucokinase